MSASDERIGSPESHLDPGIPTHADPPTERQHGDVAVVTGAGGTVGRAIAAALAEAGWRVALVGRTASSLAATSASIGDPSRTSTFVADVSVQAEIAELRQDVIGWAGRPSVLVNAHGQFGPMKSMLEADTDEWLDAFRANFDGTLLMCRAFVPDMIDDGFGRVLNVTSAASLGRPRADATAYATSKSAVNTLTRHLAVSLRGTGVTANVFHPGEVRSAMWEHIRDSADLASADQAKFADWAERVGTTGGDPPEKSGRLVVDIVCGDGSVNGAFLWIDDPIQTPRETWEPDPGA